ncbi:hypothetical protein EZV62_017017 [Acer yangbiense]|uniref:Disease resistance protein At4g27190-like leucine-rich repeats domain-containing protein n=1 Tax=Acer yangbiense TaxID=1000413 RepID=A0A5C7HQX1_9ROSI|nr:hypothetical protein EZV62_017017 [Acer yangbiense]
MWVAGGIWTMHGACGWTRFEAIACGACGEVGGNKGLAEFVAAACGACGEIGGNEGLAKFVVNGVGTATLAPESGSVFFRGISCAAGEWAWETDKMDKLRKIWHHQLTSDSFCKLDSFGVLNCHNVLNVFPSNMIERLQKLDELWLIKCSSLDEIFELEASSSGKTQAITATQMRKLVLRDLPKLKHVWNIDSQCLLSFQNLLSIEVLRCDSLKSIFPASIARSLLQLEQLWIEKCCMVEEIFAKGEEVDDAVPGFPQLTFLRLAELSKLRSFYPKGHISEWLMLKKLQVWNCDKVEISGSNFLRFQVTDGESQPEMPVSQPLLLFDKFSKTTPGPPLSLHI